MKEISFDKKVGKNHYLEITAFSKYPQMTTIPFGFRFAIGLTGLYIRLSCIIEIDLDLKVNCDHAGINLLIDTPFFQLLDLEFYDTRHQDVK
jgi:hypothetical protein